MSNLMLTSITSTLLGLWSSNGLYPRIIILLKIRAFTVGPLEANEGVSYMQYKNKDGKI